MSAAPGTFTPDMMNREVARAGIPVIPCKELNFDKTVTIGSSTGSVYKATCRGSVVAVKIIPTSESVKVMMEYRKEMAALSNVRHPNVVLFLGTCAVADKLLIITELMSNDLSQLMNSSTFDSLSLTQRLHMARETACGMTWLHDICNIIHRGLKPANLLLDNSFHVKICDIGITVVHTATMLPFHSVSYVAPEIIQNVGCDKKSDVYSFGVILYELTTSVSKSQVSLTFNREKFSQQFWPN